MIYRVTQNWTIKQPIQISSNINFLFSLIHEMVLKQNCNPNLDHQTADSHFIEHYFLFSLIHEMVLKQNCPGL